MEDLALPAEAIRASAGDVGAAEEFINGRLSPEEFESTGWTITTQGRAAWALARYREAAALADGIRRQAKEWRDDVDAWEHDSLAPLNRTLDFFGENLRRYALDVRAESGDKVKTIGLPGGRIETRAATRPRIVVDDEETFTDWCGINQPGAIKTTVEAKVSLLRFEAKRDDGAVWAKLYDPDTGEEIPGVHAEWSAITAEVKV